MNLRPAALLALVSLLLLALLPHADAGATRPVAPARHILGPGTTREPGFTGYVTADGAALGVARLPDGRFGICLDTGRRTWPAHSGHTTIHRDPAAGYLLSRYLPAARHDPITAAALWWAVGLDLGLNSGQDRMRDHLRVVRDESAGLFARILTRHRELLADVRGHAAVRYTAGRPALGADRITDLAVHGAGGSNVPGVIGVLHLSGGSFAQGGHTWRGPVPSGVAGGPRWMRTTDGPVRLTVRYVGVPAAAYELVSAGSSSQRVAVALSLGSLSSGARLPALPLPSLRTTISTTRLRVPGTIADSVEVSGADRADVVGDWQLLGPVRPGSDGCSALVWTSAPRFAAGSFLTHGDGTYTVGSTVVDRPGCYTYVERLEPSPTTRATTWTTAGEVTETGLGLGQVAVRTRVSAQRVIEGAVLSDHVSVSGVPADTTATLRWRLLGPVPPHGSSCRATTWSGAPVRAQGAAAVNRNGMTTVGAARVTRGGCYTYQESLDATPLTFATPWTAAGLVTESAAVLPPAPSIPRHPLVDTGGSRSRAVQLAARSGRSRVQISATGLTSALGSMAFAGARMRPPSVGVAGIWNAGAGLADLVGTTVVAGHVSDDRGRPAAFSSLHSVRRGTTIETTTSAGRITRWRVTDISTYDRAALPRSLFVQGLDRRLVLITCTAKISFPDGAFHYRRNLVVTAVPEPA